ncbi:MAG: MBL fold metallo-hydrolase [Cytophagales bacterium]|jgi:metallo-beta-lactamase family protein|nr:MBL fold metallo-hydrolase [Cytophagales bacterium]
MNSGMKLTFLGAAGTVTGSKYLLQTNDITILIDCGLFQGLKQLRVLNWEKFPVDPSSIDLVLVTHGHLDHVGHLPRLVKEGFSGPIWCTAPTCEIAKVILEDSAKIQEEAAEHANRFRYSKHKKALPLYDLDDVQKTIPLFVSQPIKEWIKVTDTIHVRFCYNGHIVGATYIELKVNGRLITFSGDIGRMKDPLLYPPELPVETDVLVIESTYGNRVHPPGAEGQLARAIVESYSKNGTILVPSFAVERTQLLMFLLWKLKKRKAIPEVPVYMDSPMGRNVLEIFHRHSEWHRLSKEECTEMCHDIIRVKTMEETMKLVADQHPKIIIAGSGMATGGRILTYFERYLNDKAATILLVGYQAEGTRGRQLLDGAREIKLRGKFFKVSASVINVDGLSAHADQAELINWMSGISKAPKYILITHGEPASAQALQDKIRQVYNWETAIPHLNQVIDL